MTVCGSAQVFPEQCVIKMTTTVEVDQLLQGNEISDVACCEGLSLFLEQLVQVVNIATMMLTEMQVENMTAHDRLESAKFIRQLLKLDPFERGRRCSAQFLCD